MIDIYSLYSTDVHNDRAELCLAVLAQKGMLSEITKRQKERRLRTMLDTNLLKKFLLLFGYSWPSPAIFLIACLAVVLNFIG